MEIILQSTNELGFKSSLLGQLIRTWKIRCTKILLEFNAFKIMLKLDTGIPQGIFTKKYKRLMVFPQFSG